MDIESLLAKGRSKTAKPPQKLKKQQTTSANDFAESAKAEAAKADSDKLESLSAVIHDAGAELNACESVVTPLADSAASNPLHSSTVSIHEDIASVAGSESESEIANDTSANADSANAETAESDLAIAVSANSESALAETSISDVANADMAIAETALADVEFAGTAIAKTEKAELALDEMEFAATAIAKTEKDNLANAETENAIPAFAEIGNAESAKANSQNADVSIAITAIAAMAKSDLRNAESAMSESGLAKSANAQPEIAKAENATLAKAESANAEASKVESTGEAAPVKNDFLSSSGNTLIQNLLTDSSEADSAFVSRVVSYLASSEFGLREIRIALYLLGRTIREGRGWLLYSNQEIEQGTNCHFTHVSTSMTSLEKYGFIERTHPKRTAEKKSFRIVWP